MDYCLKRNNGRIVWTSEQIEYVTSKYVDEYCSLRNLANEFKCDPDAIRTVLRNADIPLRTRREMHPRNSDYFCTIDSSDKAYWLGLLYADGCVSSKGDQKSRISLGMIDREHIEKFLVALGATNNKITTVKPCGYADASNVYYASVFDKKMRDDLINHGCIPRKTKNGQRNT